MTKISAVIITKNEEKNIRRCIESITDIVDEVIVIDSYSTDDTKKYVMNWGGLFIQKNLKTIPTLRTMETLWLNTHLSSLLMLMSKSQKN